MQSYWAKKGYIKKKVQLQAYSNRNGLGHQHGRHFIVVIAAGLAQSVERLTAEREVAGSIPGV